MKYKIEHITEYYYQNTVAFCHNQAILKPIQTDTQKVEEYEIKIEPTAKEVREFIDFFGNNIVQFFVQEPHKMLRVISTVIIHKVDMAPSYASITMNVSQTKYAMQQTTDINIICAKQFLFESSLVGCVNDDIYNYAKISFWDERNVFEACVDLMNRIYHDFKFVSGATTISTTVEQVFREKKGVCQDFAHFAISCIRCVGLPARYVSGYIETLPPQGEERLIGADASHAWFSIFIPEFGWIDFDPTNNCIPNMQHITVAYGRDYGDVVPLKGVLFSSGNNYLRVSVDITRIN